MCTGAEAALAASAVATAAGSYMSYDANQDKIKAQREAAMAEMLRQEKVDREKQQNFNEALKLADRDTQQQNIDEAVARRQENLEENVGLPGQDAAYQAPSEKGAPRVVKDHADQKRQEAEDFVSMLGNARARLGGWGEGLSEFRDGITDLDWWNSEMNRRAGRSAQIGELEARMAGMEAGNEKALAGGLLSSAGSAGMGYAGQSGAFANMLGTGAQTASTASSVNTANQNAKMQSPTGNNYTGANAGYYY